MTQQDSKILVVGCPRGGTSLVAAELARLGLRTVVDERGHPDYPAGFMEHLPILLFTKACERLRGHRDRLTTEALIEERFLSIDGMKKLFDSAFRVFGEEGVDFVKIPDLALALPFMHRRFENLRYLGVWRRPETTIRSIYRREYGRLPGIKGLFYAVGIWNMYAMRLIEFKRSHPELIELVNVDDLVSQELTLEHVIGKWVGPLDPPPASELDAKKWRSSSSLFWRTLPRVAPLAMERISKNHAPYFRTEENLRDLQLLSKPGWGS